MEHFISTTFGLITLIGGVIVVSIIGALYVIGLWKKGKDNQDDRLIKILEGTVNALEKKVDDQKKEHDDILSGLTKQINELTEKVTELESENETLIKVLQGRDEQTQIFYKKAFEAIELGTKTYAEVGALKSTMGELVKALTEHFKTPIVINNQNKK